MFLPNDRHKQASDSIASSLKLSSLLNDNWSRIAALGSSLVPRRPLRRRQDYMMRDAKNWRDLVADLRTVVVRRVLFLNLSRAYADVAGPSSQAGN